MCFHCRIRPDDVRAQTSEPVCRSALRNTGLRREPSIRPPSWNCGSRLMSSSGTNRAPRSPVVSLGSRACRRRGPLVPAESPGASPSFRVPATRAPPLPGIPKPRPDWSFRPSIGCQATGQKVPGRRDGKEGRAGQSPRQGFAWHSGQLLGNSEPLGDSPGPS